MLICKMTLKNIFYFAKRTGFGDKTFYLIKFKTMTDWKNNMGNLLPDVNRITKVGRFLRSYSLDELPQLLNVIKGEMALVGPRPLLEKYIPLYTAEQARRNEVKPGMTGWAQVNGRNSITWKEKFEYDVWYVDNVSFWLDVRILFLTLKKVVIREGISSANSVTAEAFNGKN